MSFLFVLNTKSKTIKSFITFIFLKYNNLKQNHKQQKITQYILHEKHQTAIPINHSHDMQKPTNDQSIQIFNQKWNCSKHKNAFFGCLQYI